MSNAEKTLVLIKMVFGVNGFFEKKHMFGIDDEKDLERMEKVTELFLLSHKYKGLIKMSRALIVGLFLIMMINII